MLEPLFHRIKREHMTQLAQYRQGLFAAPQLRLLFLELTLRCNERCLHCGSRCGERQAEELSAADYRAFLDQIRRDFDISHMQLCITGGEPLLRRDFFEIMTYAHQLGFLWGMTSNGTLIDGETARKLEESGMGTISVSLDGLRESHDWFRQTPGGFDRAVAGVEALLERDAFQHVQVTTVVHRQNIGELDALYHQMTALGVDSWRVINIDPIGRALDYPELLLRPEDYRTLLDFIKDHRFAEVPVCYGCSHYLGLDYEREVRDWYFLCNAGIYTASVRANGDISACLDIAPRAELTYGNIKTRPFRDAWENGFQAFRQNLSDGNQRCAACPEAGFCHGGAAHTWDFDRQAPAVCFRDILF